MNSQEGNFGPHAIELREVLEEAWKWTQDQANIAAQAWRESKEGPNGRARIAARVAVWEAKWGIRGKDATLMVDGLVNSKNIEVWNRTIGAATNAAQDAVSATFVRDLIDAGTYATLMAPFLAARQAKGIGATERDPTVISVAQ